MDELAESFVANCYFPNEPIVVLPEADGKRAVVDGNRRTSSLMILLGAPVALEAGIKFEMTAEPSAELAEILLRVPAVEVSDREEFSAYLGFRHINGLRTWAAEAKARYVHAQVLKAVGSGSTSPFTEVDRKIGSNSAWVRNAYLAYETLRFARDEFGLRGLVQQLLDERFGVWQLLLNIRNVPSYSGLGEPARDFGGLHSRIAGIHEAETARVIAGLLPREHGKVAVLSDSRDVTRYSEAIGDHQARATFDRHGDLRLAAAIFGQEMRAKRCSSFELASRSMTKFAGVLSSLHGIATLVYSRGDRSRIRHLSRYFRATRAYA